MVAVLLVLGVAALLALLAYSIYQDERLAGRIDEPRQASLSSPAFASTGIEDEAMPLWRRYPWMPDSIAVIDLETTGLDPERHQIIEVAAVILSRHTTVKASARSIDLTDHFSALVKPLPGCRISSRITEITGLDRKKLLAEGKEHEQVIREFLVFIGSRTVVAYNADFDVSFIRLAAQRYGLEFRNQQHCALAMMRLAYPGLRSYKLGYIAELGKVLQPTSHRALSDVQMTIPVYFSAGEQLHRRGVPLPSR